MSDARTRQLERLELERKMTKLQAEGDMFVAKLRAEEETYVTNLAANLVDIRSQCNACTPVYLLPDEILSCIFMMHRDLTLDLDGPPKGLNKQQKQHFLLGFIFSPSDIHSNVIRYNEFVPWIEPSHVSKRWRRVAVDCPFLWNTLYLQSRPWTEECILRSKKAKLHIHLHSPLHKRLSPKTETSRPISGLPELKFNQVIADAQVASRVARLSTYTDTAWTNLQFNSSLLPNLEHLSISHETPRTPTFSASASGSLRLRRVLSLNPPSLLSLRVDGFQPDVLTDLSIPTLQELYFSTSFLWTLDLEQCLRVLNRLPALRVCTLERFKGNETSSIDTIPQVELPHLVTLSLRVDSIETSLRFLRKIATPSGLSIQLDVGGQSGMYQPLGPFNPFDPFERSFRALFEEHLPILITQRARGNTFHSWIIVNTKSSFGFTLSSNPDLAKVSEPFRNEPVLLDDVHHPLGPWSMIPPCSEIVFSVRFHSGCERTSFCSLLSDCIGEYCQQVESMAYQDLQSNAAETKNWVNLMSTLPKLSYLHVETGEDVHQHKIIFDALGWPELGFENLATLVLRSVDLYDWSRFHQSPLLGSGSSPYTADNSVQQQNVQVTTYTVLYRGSAVRTTGTVHFGNEGDRNKRISGPTRPSGPASPIEFPLISSSSRSGHPLPPMLARRQNKGLGLKTLILKTSILRTDVLAELLPVAPLVWLEECQVQPAPWEV
ncbi:hypothetical protein DL96DRAFT_1571378 [Flagelloscypha sp. PMI_526]|nr:hypothetical protein DL96DRAFT_1571378 [Flagelloscypha sp. PMI_526]